jgi:hypothetical protein
VQLVHLLLGDLDLLQGGRDLVERQKATLVAVGNQPPQLVQILDRGAISKQNLVVDPSALLGVPPARQHAPARPLGPRDSCLM